MASDSGNGGVEKKEGGGCGAGRNRRRRASKCVGVDKINFLLLKKDVNFICGASDKRTGILNHTRTAYP
jgi:hypothetical protein